MATPKIDIPKIDTSKTGKRTNEINESDRSWLESFGIRRSLTDYEQEAMDAPLKETAEAPKESSDGSSMSKEELNITMKGLKKLYNSLESKPKEELTEAEKEFIKILDAYKATGTGTGFLNRLQKAATDTSKPTVKDNSQGDSAVKTENQKAEKVKTDNPEGDLSSSRDVAAELNEISKAMKEGRLDDAQKLADQAAKKYGDTSKSKATNSETTEETAAPETGEAKVEGEPEVKTEQAQTTQEPKSEAKQTSTESSEMTPEEAYEYLSDKKNFKEANIYFSSGKDNYIGTNGKHLPKSWFEVYKGNKDSDHSIFRSPNNKDVFTASLRDKGLLEDPNKEPSREDTVKTLAEADAKAKFDKEINSRGNKLKGIIGRHPWLTGGLALSVGVPAIFKLIDELGDWGAQKAIENNHVSDEAFFGGDSEIDDYNGEPIEPEEVTKQLNNASQETGQADNTAEEQAAQVLQENLPQGVAGLINQGEGESPVATNTATPTSTAANSAPARTAESAPTQGLPPVVTRDAPPTNAGSSSMPNNPSKPNDVTAALANAMKLASSVNPEPQAGSDAIGYGDLYDQNFIDYWAKRNPNLAFGVSQGRR